MEEQNFYDWCFGHFCSGAQAPWCLLKLERALELFNAVNCCIFYVSGGHLPGGWSGHGGRSAEGTGVPK